MTEPNVTTTAPLLDLVPQDLQAILKHKGREEHGIERWNLENRADMVR